MDKPKPDSTSPRRFESNQGSTLNRSGKLAAAEKQARVNEWRARKAAAKRVKSTVKPKHKQYLPHNDTVEQATVRTLTPKIIHSMLSFTEWAEVSTTIQSYQDKLVSITKELKKEGKKCTGCALNPHKANLAKQLNADFADSKVITDREMDLIKSALKTDTLQVGFRNGQAYIR
jgi:hypothetical protein